MFLIVKMITSYLLLLFVVVNLRSGNCDLQTNSTEATPPETMGITRAAGFLIFRRVSDRIEYLLLRASYGSKHWTPPKGHVDPGEDDFTTALRETQEEAGYSAADLLIHKDLTKTLEYVVKGKNKTVVYWLAELRDANKTPTLSDEHTEYRWLNLDESIALSGFRDFSEMVRYFHEQIKSL